MKKNKIFILTALILTAFFLAQFAAEIFFLIGPKPKPGRNFQESAFDLKKISLSSRLHTDTAFAWFKAGTSAKDDYAVKTSMALLRQALHLNPLDYQARYYLAKAYLQFSTVNNDYFDLGVSELKRAARIRGSNKEIALDCARVFFSIWPLLEDEDKFFAADLIAAAMPALSWREFSPLVEMWALYIQDTSLLMGLLKRKPEFFGPAADQLVASAIPIEQRHELLVLHEIHTLDALERRCNELNLQGEIGFDDALSLLGQLRRLKGYSNLQPDSGFSQEKYAKLQRSLLLQVISGLLIDPKDQSDRKKMSQLREFILLYIADHSGLNDLDYLQKLLEENNYFKDNDFPTLYLKTLITYKKGSYGDIIAEIEALHKSISFVKKEQLADYTNILLLLVDSYYSSKLLTPAEKVANELYQNQSDNPDILYRVLRVQNILGAEGSPDKALDAKLEAIQNSRFLTIQKANVNYDIFLFNTPEIEINLAPALLVRFKPKQLVQVFADGKIAFESYVDELPEKIVIGPPFSSPDRKVTVQVLIK